MLSIAQKRVSVFDSREGLSADFPELQAGAVVYGSKVKQDCGDRGDVVAEPTKYVAPLGIPPATSICITQVKKNIP